MKGTINAFDERAGVLYISCPILGDISDVLDKSSEVEVILKDAREITPAQRRCIHALVHDITAFISGYAEKRHVIAETMNALELNYLIDTADSEEVRFILTNNYCRLTGIDFFSLSARSENTIDQSTASDFIDWLVNLCVENAIPCSESLLNRASDITRYMYACVANKRCCICGKPADIHEVETVGMGRNRGQIAHLGQLVEPLCREHHREAHSIGQTTFDAKYHTDGIRLDEKLCGIIGWKTND